MNVKVTIRIPVIESRTDPNSTNSTTDTSRRTDTNAECHHDTAACGSRLWFLQPDSPANCDVCKKAVRYCGNRTNLYKHMKSHDRENNELQEKRKAEEGTAADRGRAPVRQSSLAESFQRGKVYPGAAASPHAPTAKGGIWAEFDTEVVASQQHRTTGSDVIIEMRHFSEEKAIPRDQDPLLWWKNKEQKFPILSKLAKKHMGVLA
ncbi:hypothetical protein NQZ68_033577 [Dissostichus eleginoides]|nr:hypothetical protein NQZ68_033577 [Dissostichus eleginoides]